MDLGGTKAYVSLMNDAAERLFDRKFPTAGHGDAEQLFGFIEECISQTIDGIRKACDIARERVRGRIKACGIAVPGPTDSERGVILNAPNLRVANFPLAERITPAIGVPTYLDNDVNLGVLGEVWKGAAKGHRNVVGIIIGTGIGGGVVIDGSIYKGTTKSAGEIGHTVLDLDSEHICPCGQRGCFEALASRKSIARDIHNRKVGREDYGELWDPENLGSNEIVYYYEKGDPDTVAVVDEAARICGKAVFNVLHEFNPEMVILSGGFIKQLEDRQLGEAFLSPIRAETAKCLAAVHGPGGEKVPITIGELDNAMLVGACKMAAANSNRNSGMPSQSAILAAAVDGLSDDDFRLLAMVYGAKIPPPISRIPDNNFYPAKLRALRNRGLIETESGGRLSKSSCVQISPLGRIIVEQTR
jgi:glucokinase